MYLHGTFVWINKCTHVSTWNICVDKQWNEINKKSCCTRWFKGVLAGRMVLVLTAVRLVLMVSELNMCIGSVDHVNAVNDSIRGSRVYKIFIHH